MLVPLLTALVLVAPGLQEPHREFDFWVGEWDVLNRHQQPDGSWRDGDTTRARITPVCDGRALLEEWAGPFRGKVMNGFSLRTYDPDQERWALLLFWTTDGNASFGKLHGSFRHGRGEFFAPDSGPNRTRYSFSDALPDTVRWDSATTKDGGLNWNTDWIMEFSRTRPASEVTEDGLFAEAWTEGALSPHPEARELDWVLGDWRGTQELAGGERREARLRTKLLSRDCLVLDVLATRAPASPTGGPVADWDERVAVRGYVAARGAWEAWEVSEGDTRLRRSVCTVEDDDVRVFERRDPRSGRVTREVWIPFSNDEFRIEVVELGDDDEPRAVSTTTLTRAH